MNQGVNIEEDTHKSLITTGSIHHNYNKRSRMLAHEHIHVKDEEIKVEVKPEVKEDKEHKIIRSFCFEVDPHAMAYLGQMFVTVSVLAISTFFLYEANGSCEKSSPWIGIISFVLGKILSSVVSST